MLNDFCDRGATCERAVAIVPQLEKACGGAGKRH